MDRVADFIVNEVNDPQLALEQVNVPVENSNWLVLNWHSPKSNVPVPLSDVDNSLDVHFNDPLEKLIVFVSNLQTFNDTNWLPPDIDNEYEVDSLK